MPPISVAIPVYQAAATLREAFACIAGQSHADLEILVVLNGSDPATVDAASSLAAEDARARVIRLESANLAAALNVALREAKHDLVARMDADDTCPPHRLATQAAWMTEHLRAAGVGCAWEQVDLSGAVTATIRPPLDPGQMRWRLLLGNPLAHGSMMLRRAAVLAVGGYDESLERAQDYDLWLRLSREHALAAVPEVLYRHRLRRTESFSASSAQAQASAAAMVREWRALAPGDDDAASMIAAAMSGSPGEAAGAMEDEMSQRGPTREVLLARLWLNWAIPPMPRRAIEVCREARVREVAGALKGRGVQRTWLWGAGSHSGWLLPRLEVSGITVEGLVDDALAGESRHGFTVMPPEAPAPGASVILSSDTREDEMWERSKAARERGVAVVRLYG